MNECKNNTCDCPKEVQGVTYSNVDEFIRHQRRNGIFEIHFPKPEWEELRDFCRANGYVDPNHNDDILGTKCVLDHAPSA